MNAVACRDCDWLHASAVVRDREEARCVRCGAALPLARAMPPGAGLPVIASAAVAFMVAVMEPLMRMSELGVATSTTLPRSAIVMFLTGSPLTAVLVAICAIVAPAVQLALVMAAGIGASRTPAPRWAGTAARLARIVTPWAMPEVMLLATLVAYVKISELAHASPGIGMFAIAALAALLALARNTAHPPTVWSRVPPRGEP